MRLAFRAFAVVTVLAGIGCGGSSEGELPPDKLDHDASAAFAGRWSGILTAESGGQSQSTSADMEVTATARNTLTLPGFCTDGSGPTARVTSDSAFTVGSHTCTFPSASCTVTWRIQGGSGSMSNGALALSVHGPVSGCSAPAGATFALTFSGTRPAAFFITFLSPPSIDAGSPGFTLQVNGTGFPGDAVVQWNGSPRTTSYLGSSLLQAQITAADVVSGGTALVTVTSASAGSTSAPATFQVFGPSAPTVFFISPASAVAGSGALTLQVSGTGFTSQSAVQWNGSPRATTFVHSGALQAQVTAADVATAGTAQVTVVNGPGGTPSSALPFEVLAPQAGVTILSLPVRDMVWDPARQKIYASLDNTSPINPNTITTVDPFTGTFDAGAFAGSQPNRLAISDDGQFLYAGVDGAAAVQRFTLPALAQDLKISLGSDQFGSTFTATDLAVAPGAPTTLAVSLGNGRGGLVVYDGPTPRTNRTSPFAFTFSSLQWGADATTIYGANAGDTGFDFYVASVNAAGVSGVQTFSGRFSSFVNRIHFDPVTRLVYSDDGHVLDPATGSPAGTYGVFGPMIPDGSAGVAVFVTNDFSSSTATVRTFDLTHFTAMGTFVVQRLTGQPTGRVVRWGTDGIAFAVSPGPGQAGGQLVLTHYPHP